MSLRATKPQINTRDALSTADLQIGAAGHNVLRADTPDQQFNMIGAGRRNLIINGDFQVNQQGVISDTPVDGSEFDNALPIDRWQLDTNDVPGLKISVEYDSKLKSKYLKLHNDGPASEASSAMQVYQHIEKSHAYRNKTLTFSAWIKSNTRFKLQMFDGVNYSDSSDVTSIHSGNNGWELLVGRFTIPDAYQVDQRHLQARITRYNNSSWQVFADEYVCISQVQLELSHTRTPFEQRSYGQELMLCQRYFQRINSWNVTPMWCYTTTDASTTMRSVVPMRIRPWYNNTSDYTGNGGLDMRYAEKHRTGLHGVHACYHIQGASDSRIYLYNADTDEMKLWHQNQNYTVAGGKFGLNFHDGSFGTFRYDVDIVTPSSPSAAFTPGSTVGAYSHALGGATPGFEQTISGFDTIKGNNTPIDSKPAYITLDAEIYSYNSL